MLIQNLVWLSHSVCLLETPLDDSLFADTNSQLFLRSHKLMFSMLFSQECLIQHNKCNYRQIKPFKWWINKYKKIYLDQRTCKEDLYCKGKYISWATILQYSFITDLIDPIQDQDWFLHINFSTLSFLWNLESIRF